MRITLFLLILCSPSAAFAQTSHDGLTKITEGCYGKLNNDNLVFVKVESITSMKPYYLDLQSGVEKLLTDEPANIPIGWMNDSTVVFFKKNDDKKFIYQLNINNGSTIQTMTLDSIIQPELYIGFDKGVMVRTNHYLEDPLQKTYRQDLNTGSISLIHELTGRKIRRISYNKNKDLIAFIEIEGGELYLKILRSGKVRMIHKYHSENYAYQCPLIFNETGTELFFAEIENSISTLNRCDLASDKISQVHSFKGGVKCMDLSLSNKNLLIMTQDENADTKSEKIDDGRFEYTLKLQFGLGIYLLNIPH